MCCLPFTLKHLTLRVPGGEIPPDGIVSTKSAIFPDLTDTLSLKCYSFITDDCILKLSLRHAIDFN